MFKKYPKVHRLGKEETDGILDGTCLIQEKIDGANVTVWFDDGEIKCGSRTREITEGLEGFVEYVKAHEGIARLFKEHPNYRLVGEWLVRHTIQYNETKMRKMYLFDVSVRDYELDGDDENRHKFAYLSQEDVQFLAEEYGLEYPQVFGVFEKPEEGELMEFVGKTNLGEKGEGIVIKNLHHKDKWGNHCHAKIVTESFKEANAVTFGGNNKHSDTYWEVYIVNKYMTLGRIEKIMHKVESETGERLDFKHIPRITNQAYYDLLTEEIWEIAGKVGSVDFKALKRIAIKKAVQIYKDKLTGSISIADQT